MIHISKNKRHLFFIWSVIVVLITLSMPKYSLNSQAIIVSVIAWLFVSSFEEKWTLFKKNMVLFLLSSSLFWISLLGLAYTQNMDEGWHTIQKQIPLLWFPILFSTVRITKETIHLFIKYFSYGVVFSALFALVKAFYFKINNLGDYFYYTEFATLLDKHTTYFALFSVIAILFFITEILKYSWRTNILNIASVLFLLCVVYLLSSRISIIAFVLGGSILVLGLVKNNKAKSIIFLAGAICLLGFYASPNFEKRFNARSPENQEISDYTTRIVHWKSAIETIQQHNILIGAGTGDGHETLYETYLKNGFKTGYKYKYNAHNQFIETGLYYGLLGLILLLLILWITFVKIRKNKDSFGIVILSCITIFMLTESILERHSGIVIFSFFISLFLANTLTHNKDKTAVSLTSKS